MNFNSFIKFEIKGQYEDADSTRQSSNSDVTKFIYANIHEDVETKRQKEYSVFIKSIDKCLSLDYVLSMQYKKIVYRYANTQKKLTQKRTEN